VFGSDGLRKHALECLRLEADCKQLAIETNRPSLQSHFVRMAGVWAALADSDLSDIAAGKMN
jgi:hypothetical protein